MTHSILAKHLQFAGNISQSPVFLFRRKEIDAESWRNNPSCRAFMPIYCKRIEVLSFEIHHREKGIHQSAFHPFGSILADNVASIPSMTPLAWKVSILSYWRTTHHYPWFFLFYGVMYSLHDACDVFSSSIAILYLTPRFRVAYVVEVYSIYIITLGKVAAKGGKIG